MRPKDFWEKAVELRLSPLSTNVKNDPQKTPASRVAQMAFFKKTTASQTP